MLADLVKAGKLPAVDKRLPDNPKVVQVVDKIGKYGGTLRMGDPQQQMDTALRIRHNGLFRYDFGITKPEPDLAEGYAWSDGYKTLTLKLRKGLKWSDGTPFTTADFMFNWEKVLNNKDITPGGLGAEWKVGGQPAEWKAVDDYTLSITWAAANPTAMDRFGRTHFSGDNVLFLPANYMKKFHKEFNPDVEKLATAENFKTWVDLFNAKRQQGYQAVAWPLDRPTMDCWVPKETATTRILLERNPYCWQIDTEGNQLPYIDKVEISLMSDQSVMDLKLTSGDFDFEPRWTAADKLTLYRQSEAKSNYKTYIAKQLEPSSYSIMFNLFSKDAQLKELFNKLPFREGVSNAINRNQINDVLFFNMGAVAPPAPVDSLPWFDPAWKDKPYLKYDVARANQKLDEAGITKKDAQGYRLLPDGKRVSLILETSLSSAGQGWAKFCELLTADLKVVGVESNCQLQEPATINTRTAANDMNVQLWSFGRATLLGRGQPDSWAFEGATPLWNSQWRLWKDTSGKEGVEPPQAIKDQMALWDQFKKVPSDSPEAKQLGAKYYGWMVDNVLPFIPTIGYGPQPVIVHNRLKNVPTKGLTWSSDHNFYAPFHAEQFYIEQ